MLNFIAIFIYKDAEMTMNWFVGSIYFIIMVILFQIKETWRINNVSRNVAFGRTSVFLNVSYIVLFSANQITKSNNK